MKTYMVDTPRFSTEMRIVETTDTNHADNINAGPIIAFENTMANRASIEELSTNKAEKEEAENHFLNTQNPHGVTKRQIGLENVENKSSEAIRDELTSGNVTKALGFTPMNQALKGASNGVAELNESGKVPSSQLPSFVDDVVECSTKSKFPTTGESGKIYIDVSTNKSYRWSGSTYVEVSPSIALGETSSTAYRGDRGKIAYEHSQKTGNPHGVTKSDVGLGNVNNTSDVNKPISTATQSALDLKADYEEGTWTPMIAESTGGVSSVYYLHSGKYKRVGNIVFATCKASLFRENNNAYVHIDTNSFPYPIANAEVFIHGIMYNTYLGDNSLVEYVHYMRLLLTKSVSFNSSGPSDYLISFSYKIS